MSTIKADATAEKRPAWFFISGVTHKYQDGVEVITIFPLEILVTPVRLLLELFVEADAGTWLLFLECRFDRSGQVVTRATLCTREGESAE